MLKAIKVVPNWSEFIRGAIIEALGIVCPHCNGSGRLTSNQKRHWDDFAIDHLSETVVNVMNDFWCVHKNHRQIGGPKLHKFFIPYNELPRRRAAGYLKRQ